MARMNMNLMGTMPLPSASLMIRSSPHSLGMPVVGMGMAADPFDASALKAAVPEAISLGYRHFDTAASYGSEQPLGEAIAEALELGLLSSRQEVFIASKLWIGDAHPHSVLPALRKSLRTLKLEYLDLYLIHWPISLKRPGKNDFTIQKNDLIPMDLKSVWRDMEDCQRLGLTRAIGVCNFSCKKLQNLLSFSQIPPAVNQVEMSPVWQQKKLREFCNSNGIVVTAYSPLGAKGASWGTNQVMDCEILKDIAKATHKTVAQVSLRWVYEQGVSLLVKSTNKKRMEENLSIFDWALTEEHHSLIDRIKQQRGLTREDFISPYGPYKSLQQLWDGEL